MISSCRWLSATCSTARAIIALHGFEMFLPDPWHVRQPVIYLDGRAIQVDRVSS